MSAQSVGQAPAPSVAVVQQVAESEGVSPTELRPLYEVVDPDALDRFVGTTGSRDTDARIYFYYHGHGVTVTASGVVHLDQTDSETS